MPLQSEQMGPECVRMTHHDESDKVRNNWRNEHLVVLIAGGIEQTARLGMQSMLHSAHFLEEFEIELSSQGHITQVLTVHYQTCRPALSE